MQDVFEASTFLCMVPISRNCFKLRIQAYRSSCEIIPVLVVEECCPRSRIWLQILSLQYLFKSDVYRFTFLQKYFWSIIVNMVLVIIIFDTRFVLWYFCSILHHRRFLKLPAQHHSSKFAPIFYTLCNLNRLIVLTGLLSNSTEFPARCLASICHLHHKVFRALCKLFHL